MGKRDCVLLRFFLGAFVYRKLELGGVLGYKAITTNPPLQGRFFVTSLRRDEEAERRGGEKGVINVKWISVSHLM